MLMVRLFLFDYFADVTFYRFSLHLPVGVKLRLEIMARPGDLVFGRAHRLSTVGCLFLQRVSVNLAVEYSSSFIVILNYIFAALMN